MQLRHATPGHFYAFRRSPQLETRHTRAYSHAVAAPAACQLVKYPVLALHAALRSTRTNLRQHAKLRYSRRSYASCIRVTLKSHMTNSSRRSTLCWTEKPKLKTCHFLDAGYQLRSTPWLQQFSALSQMPSEVQHAAAGRPGLLPRGHRQASKAERRQEVGAVVPLCRAPDWVRSSPSDVQ